MAKMKLAEGGFSLIPVGVTVFKVTKVDDSKYDKFGKLAVTLTTKEGKTHVETFTLIKIVKNRKETNEGALKAWSYFAKNCLNNFDLGEIDTDDLVGCYIQARVEHEDYEYEKEGEKKKGTAVRLKEYNPASGFPGSTASPKTKVEDEDEDEDEDDIDLDEFIED